MSLSVKRIYREFRNYLADQSFDLTLHGVSEMVYYDQQEARFENRRVAQPNEMGVFLLALWYHFVAQPLAVLKYATCDHKDWVDDSWAGPDSGGVGGHCERCGYSFSHTYY